MSTSVQEEDASQVTEEEEEPLYNVINFFKNRLTTSQPATLNFFCDGAGPASYV